MTCDCFRKMLRSFIYPNQQFTICAIVRPLHTSLGRRRRRTRRRLSLDQRSLKRAHLCVLHFCLVGLLRPTRARKRLSHLSLKQGNSRLNDGSRISENRARTKKQKQTDNFFHFISLSNISERPKLEARYQYN